MSIAQYALNAGLLVYILASNLGTRRLTRARLLLPGVLVVVAAVLFLREIPTGGNDVTLELAGAATGGQDSVGLRCPAYAALWLAVIGGRVAFAYGADHWFSRNIATFSISHQITGADAWTAAFVLMALVMLLVRALVTALVTAALTRTGTPRSPVVAA